jgi:hypothetical protein
VGAQGAGVAIDAADRIHDVWTQITLPGGYPPLGGSVLPVNGWRRQLIHSGGGGG